MRHLLLLTLLSACTAPNHLGNPLLLPVRGLATTLENAAYAQERGGVTDYITQNADAMRAEGFAGPATDALLETLPTPTREKVRMEIAEVSDAPDFAERATIIVMVHR